jgi:hypothetical protein
MVLCGFIIDSQGGWASWGCMLCDAVRCCVILAWCCVNAVEALCDSIIVLFGAVIVLCDAE